MIENSFKCCSHCKIEKNITGFYKDNSKKDGLTVWCKECSLEANNVWKNNNRQHIKKYNKKYKKKYYEVEANANKIRNNSLNYYENNKEKLKPIRKIYTDTHRAEINKRQRERMHSNPVLKLRQNVSAKVCKALKGNKKDCSILDYLPYSMEDLKSHLEKQFDSNMSWDNYGIYWHIDHIMPQSRLPFLSMKDDNFKKCWDLKNLRPLEAIENMKKHNKIIGNK